MKLKDKIVIVTASMAETVAKSEGRIDVLVNNFGTLLCYFVSDVTIL